MLDIKDELLHEIKIYLQVSDNHDNDLIIDMLKASIRYFQNKVSKEFEIDEPLEKMLIFNRVRYEFNRVLNEFEKNYLSDILDIQDYYNDKDETTII